MGLSCRTLKNFNPRAPCGARLPSCAAVIIAPRFQPTRPLRGATGLPARRPCAEPISTHAPLAGRDTTFEQAVDKLTISTHAPLAGRDYSFPASLGGVDISTHAPLAGRDVYAGDRELSVYDISTHAPLAGRDVYAGDRELSVYDISTHAPLAGRDVIPVDDATVAGVFQPTRPLRGATFINLPTDKGQLFQPTRPLRGATSPSVCPR